MIQRILSKKLRQAAKKFPAIALTGPRQSGKTTLTRNIFPDKPYASLEDPDTREFAISDPRGFLNQYPKGAVLDEVQRVPQLFSYLQGVIDKNGKPGMFILTGSQQFLLLQNISQTLAGRVRILHLLPFSLEEIRGAYSKQQILENILFRGMYPPIHHKKINPIDWYPSYSQTYIERDVQSIKGIHDLHVFHKFVKMCAARTGCLINYSSIANDCGITHNTARSWIGILEASFIVYLLQPHHQNFNKRLVKMPKLYFYDTGLVCSLMGINHSKQLETHPNRGSIFETFVMSELIKRRYNLGLPINLYFWRDKSGHEIDCIAEEKTGLVPIEIKSGETVTEDFFKNLNYWKKLSKKKTSTVVIYGGKTEQNRKSAKVISWENAGCFLDN